MFNLCWAKNKYWLVCFPIRCTSIGTSASPQVWCRQWSCTCTCIISLSYQRFRYARITKWKHDRKMLDHNLIPATFSSNVPLSVQEQFFNICCNTTFLTFYNFDYSSLVFKHICTYRIQFCTYILYLTISKYISKYIYDNLIAEFHIK